MRRRSVLALIAGAVLAPASGAVTAPLPARFALRHDDPRFGGFSALHLAANGLDCLLLSDRAVLFALRLERDAAGQIAAARVLSTTVLRTPKGEPLTLRQRDSEGLAVGPAGDLFISFEGANRGRVWRLPHLQALPEALPRSALITDLPPNRGLEALAIDPRGRLFAMAEDPPEPDLPLLRLDGAEWRIAGHLPRAGNFHPVSLDFGPDGALYLLERAFRLPATFASRLSRIGTAGTLTREILWQSAPGALGNLEGLSLTRTPSGRLRATMVSDDNLLPLLRSDLVEVLLT